jgi:transposase-like protein
VAQALRPNAVVADIAEKHGIHGNLLRQWIAAVKRAFPKS